MLFYRQEPPPDRETPPNEAKLLNPWPPRLTLLGCAVGGLFYAAALPPLNLSVCAAFALLPVMIHVSVEHRWHRRMLGGWLWGWCWAICSYRFLREIEWFIPWLMAPVMALFPMAWTLLLGYIARHLVYPPVVFACGMDERQKYLEAGPRTWRLVILGAGAAALYVAIEFTRSRLFVWNDLAVTQYRNVPLLQIAALTGSYGVGFGVALVNSIWWMCCFRRGWRAALYLAGFVLLWFLSGWCYTAWRPAAAGPEVRWKILAVQGDLSQRRHATVSQVEESLTVYEELSHRAWAKHPEADIMVWPESAIPILFISNIPRFSLKMPRGATLNARYQNIVRDLCVRHRRKLLFGALDLEFDPRKRPRQDAPPPGVTNSALLFDEEGNFEARYDKFHRVPFGEYIPFRQYLPDAWARMVDMGRDLVPGVPPNPLADIDMRTKQGDRCMIRPGVVICYEGVFSYVTRLLCRRGANVLIALSNDAWYPTSSEPEQHLANATLRAVECGIPMVRVGNNSGTGIVMPSGRFEQALEVPGAETRPEIRRGRGFRVLEVPVTEYPNSTVFMCIGDLLPWLLVGFSALLVIYSMAYDCNVMEFPDDMEKQLRREHPEQYPPRNF